jgi:DNA-binding response OmpR family regulator
MYKILLVEDSVEYISLVQKTLGFKYHVHVAHTLADARKLNAANTYDLVLLDVLLPDGSGFEYCSELQASSEHSGTPIVVLSGRGEVQDKVMGWSLGADDYIVKPFAPLEFQARVQNRIDKHRLNANIGTILRWSSIILDLPFHEAKIEEDGVERKLDLTPIEFKILQCFVKSAERALSRSQLIYSAWGSQIHVSERTVDKHISTLRQKLNSRKVFIRTISGLGYSLVRS